MKKVSNFSTTIKVLMIAPITTAVLLSSASLVAQTQAMELRVSDTGRISIYEDRVLGDTTDAMNTRGNSARPTQEPYAVRELPARTNQNIEFRRNGDAVQVDVVQELPTSVRMPNGDEAQRAQERQRFEANRLETTMPAARKSIESIPTTPDGTTAEEVEMQQKRSEHVQRILEERSTRTDETVELYKAGQDGESDAEQAIREMRIRDGVESPEEADFELRSRDVEAKIRNSAVTFNPETNSISIVTPSGITKELNHLPDQAIERFKEFTLIADKSALEVIPTETDEVYYRTLSERPVRVFGLFPRQIQTELLLNDETGEVVERKVGNDSMLVRFLDAMSF